MGPGLQDEDENQPAVPACHTCQSANKRISTLRVAYAVQPFKQTEHHPVLTSVLDPERRFPSSRTRLKSEGGMRVGPIKDLVPGSESLLIFTAYTASEAEKDWSGCSNTVMKFWCPTRTL